MLAALDAVYKAGHTIEIYAKLKSLRTVYADSDDITGFLIDFNSTCEFLRSQGREPAAYDKLMLLREATQSCSWIDEVKTKFEDEIESELQTYDELVRRIYKRNTTRTSRAVKTSTTTGAGHYANAVTKTYQVQLRGSTETWDRAKLLKLSKPNPLHVHYCHTHGTHCQHLSCDCKVGKRNLPSHKLDATMDNKMSDCSTRYKSNIQKVVEAAILANRVDFP